MIFKIKYNFNNIYKVILFLLLTNIPNMYAHNLFNGGCKEYCEQKVEAINNEEKLSNEKKLNNNIDQINIERKNSCLNKSLCRG